MHRGRASEGETMVVWQSEGTNRDKAKRVKPQCRSPGALNTSVTPEVFDSFSLGFQRIPAGWAGHGAKWQLISLRTNLRCVYSQPFQDMKIGHWCFRDWQGLVTSGWNRRHWSTTWSLQFAFFALHRFLAQRRAKASAIEVLGLGTCHEVLHIHFISQWSPVTPSDKKQFLPCPCTKPKDRYWLQGPLPAEHLHRSVGGNPWNEQVPAALFAFVGIQDLPASCLILIEVFPAYLGVLNFEIFTDAYWMFFLGAMVIGPSSKGFCQLSTSFCAWSFPWSWPGIAWWSGTPSNLLNVKELHSDCRTVFHSHSCSSSFHLASSSCGCTLVFGVEGKIHAQSRSAP